MKTYATVVLAAGKGTRMRSALPKVLHPLAGLPLLAHVLNAVEAIPSAPVFAPLAATTVAHPPIVVIGSEAAQVEAAFGARCSYAFQHEQLGTGHAVLAAREAIDRLRPLPQTILVCYGDTPLISADVLARVLAEHVSSGATLTFLTATSEQPSDFGRVVRDSAGQVLEIVELRRATEEQRSIKEVNSGVYCFERAWLWSVLPDLPRNALSGEYYLTDLVAVARAQGCKIATVSGALEETIGVNDRVQLAAAEQLLRRRILERHMYAGVTIVDPAATYIDAEVSIGPDTVILPGTMITGKTRIGAACRIGPGTTIESSIIGDRCIIRNSALEETTLEDDVRIGPFSHCRPGAHLARGVRMGNFGEVKNAYIGAETDIHHFSYIGDATVGEHVNIGAGTVTSNYNGITRQKYRTTIGDGAFIGCDTIIVPPVSIGAGAMTGANAVVNRDVPPQALVVGVPARLLRMLDAAETVSPEGSKKE
jgi:bifunctional UDP-N-acetylglucosamine pyrophosphorylase/glucosamine-1-phosphate N-acetyltransferase